MYLTWVGLSLALTGLGGCYMDVTAGAAHAQGGVKGYGWEISLAGGIGWDFGGVVRASAGVDASMAHTAAEDGKFGSKGFGYHGRADIAISGSDAISREQLQEHHAMLDASTPGGLTGISGQTRVSLDYGRGSNQELHFISPNDPMRYTDRSTVHSFYLGIAREYASKGLTASFGIGPHVTYMPGAFVGDSTTVGVQAHVSAWFFPVFRPKKTENLMEHYTPSDPSAPLPDRNRDPVNCPDGTIDKRTGNPC
jgi:hypothetical protein